MILSSSSPPPLLGAAVERLAAWAQVPVMIDDVVHADADASWHHGVLSVAPLYTGSGNSVIEYSVT